MSAAPSSGSSGGARLPVVVLGAGKIGRMHAQRMAQHADVVLAGVADPSPAAREWAASMNVPWSAEPAELLARVKPGAAIVASPNALHLAVGLACVEAGVPALIEKPVADTLVAATALADAARARRVPLLVGHQRRHSAVVQRAKALIAEGAIGRPVAVSLMATWFKPAPYFDENGGWRRLAGGGPVLINLIHDMDLLRHLVGEVASVHAFASTAERGFEVEDTAAAVLRLRNGALATALVTDAAVSPWNYDLGAGEWEPYARLAADALYISGTEGAMSLPQLQRWHYRGERSWHQPLVCEHEPLHGRDPYAEQLRHLRAVAEGREPPLCSAEDGIGTLRATLALLESAATGRTIEIESKAQA